MKKILILAVMLVASIPIDSFAIKKITSKTQTKVIKPLETPKITDNRYVDLVKANKLVGGDLLKALKARKLIAPEYIQGYISQMSKFGYCYINTRYPDSQGMYSPMKNRVYASKELLHLLLSLVNAQEITPAKPFSILSLFRYGSKAHAEMQSNGDIIGRAVDIDYYAGYKIHMENPQNSLEAIVRIIKNFPQENFTLGLPRPGGGSLIDPSQDFFLPVNNLDMNERSPTGSLPGDLNMIVNKYAQKRIRAAIYNNKKATIQFMMPDAVDHFHIKVYPSMND